MTPLIVPLKSPNKIFFNELWKKKYSALHFLLHLQPYKYTDLMKYPWSYPSYVSNSKSLPMV